jgi:acetyl esterase/lipase
MVSQTQPKYDPSAHYEVESQDIEYRRDGDETRSVRIYRPKGDGPFPAIVDAHGGVWGMGSRTGNELMDKELAASGLVVAAIDLPLAPKHTHPAQAVDFNYATRWLKSHASEFTVAPNSVGGMGASSGGNTAMLSALRPHEQRFGTVEVPNAANADASLAFVIALWPVIDQHARYLYAKDAGKADIVSRTEAYFPSEDAMKRDNPQLIIESSEAQTMPPMIVIAPDPDENVPKPIFERFVESYGTAGGDVEIEWFPGAYHGFGRELSPDTERALKAIKHFVARRLKTS